MSKCVLCNFTKQDPRYGEFITKGDISVHEFCLYLSSGLVQNGQEHNGLYGFLPKDIYAEKQRGKQMICFYCRKPYASIGCCENKCRRSFHMICGIDNGCENQFTGTFQSYCKQHIHKFWKKGPPKNEKCCICFDSLEEPGRQNHYVNFIRTPCCQNGWFHKLCLQNFARTAGYFFKCPLCNDNKKFRKEMPNRGIFVPDRDAAWELEPNAFSELLERPNKCEAEICKHKQGRNADNDRRNPLLYCTICGAMAAHLLCLPNGASNYTCKECLLIGESRSDGDSGRGSFQEVIDKNDNDGEDEEIDVCNVSDTDEELDILERPVLSRKREVIPINSNSSEKIIKEKLNDNYDESSSDDEDLFWRIGLKRKMKNSARIIDSEDSKSSTSGPYTNKILSDTSDEGEIIKSLKCITTKRRKILKSDSSEINSEEESDEDKFSKQKDSKHLKHSPYKPMHSINSISTDSNDRSASSNTKRVLGINPISIQESKTDKDALNISCVANRTRRRKSVFYTNPLEKLDESDANESGEVNENMNVASSSIGHSSYQSFSGFLTSNSVKRSSTNMCVNRNQKNSVPNLDQKARTTNSRTFSISSSSSLSPAKSSTSVTTTSSDLNSDNNNLNISCVANRTRRRKPVYNTNSSLKSLTEHESYSSSSSSSLSFQKENKRKDTKRSSNSSSSTDNSPQLLPLKRSRLARLISTTTEDDDDDAMKNR